MIGALSRTIRNIVVSSAVILSAATTHSLAADMTLPAKAPLAPPPVLDAWTYRLTPYGWALALSGSTTVKGYTTDIDASFADILNHTQFPKGLLEFAAFGEARYGRFALLTDLAYMKLGIGGDISRSRDIGRLATLGIGASAGLTIQMFIAEIAAAYEVAHWGATTAPGSGTALDLYAGARIWWQEGEAQFAVSGALAGLGPLGLALTKDGNLSAKGTVDWVDPVIGARLRHQFYPGLNLLLSGDVGGFDVGSKFSWQAIAALDYDFMRWRDVIWSGMIGFKALNVDYSQGSGLSHYEFDMTMYGPIFGLTARW
jgi:hypothetical protein